MDISEYMKNKHRKHNYDYDNNEDNKKIKYLKFLITRVLLSVILVISVSIYIKLDQENVVLVEKYFFEENLQFTKINNWYKENLGEIIPDVNKNSELVFSSSEIKNREYVEYENGVKINLGSKSPISILSGGIVVFIGEKDNYGNTIIVQGNDGIDYWYGGITNVSINLYDYIEKDTLIGESINDYIYLVLQKDGKYIKYEEIL